MTEDRPIQLLHEVPHEYALETVVMALCQVHGVQAVQTAIADFQAAK